MNELLSILTIVFSTLLTLIIETTGLITKIVTLGRYRFVLLDFNNNPTKMNGLLEFLKNNNNHLCTSEVLTNDGYIPRGIIVAKWWLVVLMTERINLHGRCKIEYSAYIFARNSDIQTMVNYKKTDVIENYKINYIQTYREKGCWLDDGFIEMNTVIPNKLIKSVDTQRQFEIVEDILAKYSNNSNKQLNVMIWGNSGSGKTHVGKLLTVKLGGILCDDFDPTLQGIVYSQLVDSYKPTAKSPLIVLIDEFDTIVYKIHNNTNGKPDNKYLRTGVYNKKTFNKFMDRLSEYENIIVILTMNSTLDYINSLDKSYMRDGRIDLVYQLDAVNS